MERQEPKQEKRERKGAGVFPALAGWVRRLLGRQTPPESPIRQVLSAEQDRPPESMPGWSSLSFKYKELKDLSAAEGSLALWAKLIRFLDQRPMLQFGGYMMFASALVLAMAIFVRRQFYARSVEVDLSGPFSVSDGGTSSRIYAAGGDRIPVLYGMEPGPVGKDLLTYKPASVNGILTPEEVRLHYPKSSIALKENELADARIAGVAGGSSLPGMAGPGAGPASEGGEAAADRTRYVVRPPADLPARFSVPDRKRRIPGLTTRTEDPTGKLQETIVQEKGFQGTTDDDCMKNIPSGGGREAFSKTYSECTQEKSLGSAAQQLKEGLWTNVQRMGDGNFHLDQNLNKYNHQAMMDSNGRHVLSAIVYHSAGAAECEITPCTLETQVTDNRCDYFGEGCLDW